MMMIHIFAVIFWINQLAAADWLDKVSTKCDIFSKG